MVHQGGSVPRRSWRRFPPWAAYAGVALVAILLYLPTMRYGFIGYDDTLLIVDNWEFLSELSNAPQAFRQDAFRVPGYESSGAYYRPIVTLSLMLDAQIGGVSPGFYHAGNIVAHAVASCLVLALLVTLGYTLVASSLLALLFAVHPALVSAVAWVPGRVESLVALFTILSVLFALRYVRRRGWISYAFHLIAFALAVCTKEVAVFLPIPLGAYLLFVRGETSTSRPWRSLVVGWGAVLALWFGLRHAALTAPSLPAGLLGEAVGNVAVLVHYLGKTLVPFHLSVAPTAEGAALYTGLAALAILVTALVRSRTRRIGAIVFGVVWYLAFALPPLLVPRIVGLEQRLYLPMAGLLVLALEAGLAHSLPRRRLALTITVAVALLFSALTIDRIRVYSSRQAFWESAVASSPNSSYARASLGAVYLNRDRLDDAREQYIRALELNPVEPKANNNLGVIAGRRGQPAEAQEFFRREIAVNPRYADAYFNLAMIRMQAGDTTSAAALWRRTLEIQADHRHALSLLAQHHARLGQTERAAQYQRRAEGR